MKFGFLTKKPDPPTPMAKVTEQAGSVPVLRVGVGVAGLGALWLLYQIVWMMVSAAAGLLALGVVAIVGLGLFQALPLLSQKWENRLLAARKREARANPIEQLQNYLLAKTQQVAAFKQAVSGIGAQIAGLEDMVDGRRRQGKDVSKQEQSVFAMKRAYGTLVTKYTDAEKALAQLRDIIEDKKFEYSFAQMGQAAMQTLNATSGKELLDAMLADEAFSSVRDNFNKVFADLDMEAAKLNNTKQLDYGSGVTIDVSAVKIPELELVGGSR